MEVLQRTANRGSISTGFDIDNSLKFEADNSESMARTNSSEGNKQICTLSMWVKRTELADSFFFTAGDNADPFFIFGFYQNKIYWSTTAGVSGSGVMQTTRLFRDTSAWYHIVLAIDTTQGTDTNRYKLYVNGIQETSFGTANYPSQNANLEIMDDVPQDVGGYTSYFYCGYIAEFVAIDGQQLAPTSFGEFDEDSGIWKPIDVSDLTFGTNGFYLDFKDSANLGNDASGNGNDFTETNITAADQATDTPTNNFCTLNPLYKCAATIMTNGATVCSPTDSGNNTVRGTFVVTKGKWYWEIAVGRGTVNANYPFMGMTGNLTTEPCSWIYGDSKSLYVSGSGNVEDAGSYKGSGTAAAYSNGTPNYSIYGFAVDMDNQTLLWYTNGTANNSGNTYSMSTSIGNSDEGMTPFLFMFVGATQSFNFGGYTTNTISSAASDENGYGTFEYAPPTGYYALCTKNLAEYG